ncbi:tRNA pseudouridine(38-40) synthase TruA [Candidatus Providencia siddallii]|uniref:tRNA pseudouridine synthase A n=1 Tax=Candidatus Providencia siddallii TaxID=1715285 RepID=A0ABM9NNM1_9GAMM
MSNNIKKIALGIEYNGSNYHGWQIQQNIKSIQSYIEKALSKFSNESIVVFCAGRTDAGVHALGQVIHFETTVIRKEISWVIGVNTYLPNDISVRWCKFVDKDFHSRYNAIARRYCYIIFNERSRPAILFNKVTHYYFKLNEKLMHEAAQYLIGEQDFSSFKSVKCQSKSSYRNILYANVNRYGSYIIIDIKANAFFYHMVRNIVGCLLEIGSCNKSINWINKLIKLKDRKKCASTAKPEGLYLVNVEYPEKFKLPKNIIESVFFLKNFFI